MKPRGAPRASRREQAVLDRIEDRLIDASAGFHVAAGPASPQDLAACGLPDDEVALWTRWNGLDLAAGDARIWSLGEIESATLTARQQGILHEGDRVIAERGRDIFVLPADPWAEGAAVIRVEEAGDRSPEASSVALLVLGWIGELSLLYDAEGEYHDDLFGDDGELSPSAERRLCRRRLDLDPDAPNARLRLAELLRQAGELNAAKAELQQVLKRAPSFAWAHFELGRTFMALALASALEHCARARACFESAAEHSSDDALKGWFLAWAARAAEGESRAALAKKVLMLRPDFAGQQVGTVAALLEREDNVAAAEQLDLGLAVVPGHLELLRLRGALNRTDS